MTTEQVAARLGVTSQRVGQLVRDGRLQRIRAGHTFTFDPDQVERLARLNRRTGAFRYGQMIRRRPVSKYSSPAPFATDCWAGEPRNTPEGGSLVAGSTTSARHLRQRPILQA